MRGALEGHTIHVLIVICCRMRLALSTRGGWRHVTVTGEYFAQLIQQIWRIKWPVLPYFQHAHDWLLEVLCIYSTRECLVLGVECFEYCGQCILKSTQGWVNVCADVWHLPSAELTAVLNAGIAVVQNVRNEPQSRNGQHGWEFTGLHEHWLAQHAHEFRGTVCALYCKDHHVSYGDSCESQVFELRLPFTQITWQQRFATELLHESRPVELEGIWHRWWHPERTSDKHNERNGAPWLERVTL